MNPFRPGLELVSPFPIAGNIGQAYVTVVGAVVTPDVTTPKSRRMFDDEPSLHTASILLFDAAVVEVGLEMGTVTEEDSGDHFPSANRVGIGAARLRTENMFEGIAPNFVFGFALGRLLAGAAAGAFPRRCRFPTGFFFAAAFGAMRGPFFPLGGIPSSSRPALGGHLCLCAYTMCTTTPPVKQYCHASGDPHNARKG